MKEGESSQIQQSENMHNLQDLIILKVLLSMNNKRKREIRLNRNYSNMRNKGNIKTDHREDLEKKGSYDEETKTRR